MITRVLEPEEWPEKLVGTELETVWPYLPQTAKVLVVEDDGRVVGSWSLIPMFHVECVSIAADHQKGGVVARKLLDGMGALAQSVGAQAVVTACIDDQVKGLLHHLRALPLDGEHYSIPVENMRCQRH